MTFLANDQSVHKQENSSNLVQISHLIKELQDWLGTRGSDFLQTLHGVSVGKISKSGLQQWTAIVDWSTLANRPRLKNLIVVFTKWDVATAICHFIPAYVLFRVCIRDRFVTGTFTVFTREWEAAREKYFITKIIAICIYGLVSHGSH